MLNCNFSLLYTFFYYHRVLEMDNKPAKPIKLPNMRLFPWRRGTAIADTPLSVSTPIPRGNRGSCKTTKLGINILHKTNRQVLVRKNVNETSIEYGQCIGFINHTDSTENGIALFLFYAPMSWYKESLMRLILLMYPRI